MSHVLVVDNHDSFVHTIVGYLSRLGAQVSVERNDSPALRDRVAEHDSVLISPGPGNPDGAGQSLAVIGDCHERGIPLLGVCLGHQALAQWCGARIIHAPRIVHGQTSEISHDGDGLFASLPSRLHVTRYHSLAVDPASVPGELRVTARTVPTHEDPQSVVMALAHRTKPMVSVQFHPEAVLTEAGYPLLANWLASSGIR